MIAELMDVTLEIETEEQRLRPEKSEVNRLWADNQKAKELIGWTAKYAGVEGLKEGLKETIDWSSNPSNLAQYKADVYNI